MSIENKFLKVTMPDGSKWKVSVRVIAEHRARYYFEEKKEFESLEQSLKEDTLQLFEEDEYEVEDWSENKMNWSDVEKYAIQIKTSKMSSEEFQEGWVNGMKEIINE